MSETFVPLDLGPLWNAGAGNVKTADGYLWPAPEGAPEQTALRNLPQGTCRFWGIPFQVADRDAEPGGAAFVVAAKGAGDDVPESVSIPVHQKALRVRSLPAGWRPPAAMSI